MRSCFLAMRKEFGMRVVFVVEGRACHTDVAWQSSVNWGHGFNVERSRPNSQRPSGAALIECGSRWKGRLRGAEHRTLNIELRTSKGPLAHENSFDVQCSKLDVRCSAARRADGCVRHSRLNPRHLGVER